MGGVGASRLSPLFGNGLCSHITDILASFKILYFNQIYYFFILT